MLKCALDRTSYSLVLSSFFFLFLYLDLIISDKNGFVNRKLENNLKLIKVSENLNGVKTSPHAGT